MYVCVYIYMYTGKGVRMTEGGDTRKDCEDVIPG